MNKKKEMFTRILVLSLRKVGHVKLDGRTYTTSKCTADDIHFSSEAWDIPTQVQIKLGDKMVPILSIISPETWASLVQEAMEKG